MPDKQDENAQAAADAAGAEAIADALERKRCFAIADRVQQLFEKEGVGGAVIIASNGGTTYRDILPAWANIETFQTDEHVVFGVKIENGSTAQRAAAVATVGFISAMHRRFSEGKSRYDGIMRSVETALNRASGQRAAPDAHGDTDDTE
jgi:hypothetical protein